MPVVGIGELAAKGCRDVEARVAQGYVTDEDGPSLVPFSQDYG